MARWSGPALFTPTASLTASYHGIFDWCHTGFENYVSGLFARLRVFAMIKGSPKNTIITRTV